MDSIFGLNQGSETIQKAQVREQLQSDMCTEVEKEKRDHKIGGMGSNIKVHGSVSKEQIFRIKGKEKISKKSQTQ